MGSTSVVVLEFAEKDPTGRYIRYDEVLGRGAFKTVYKAFDEINGIEVAWNQVSIEDVMQSPLQLERLYSEVHLLKSLKHENIIKLYHSWVDDQNKTINMITELFTSGSLRMFRKKHRTVDVKAIKNWARQILRGLHYLHSHNPPIIHRDLKCDNIFVNGNNGRIKIGDLGLAIVMQQPTARSVIGTPEFMAPELYEEEYNELVDIYSFGMCMLEIVTCEYPYSECRNPAQIYKKVTLGIMPASLAKVNDLGVKEFIEKCLVPASMRLSAAELLEDPFLFSENSKDVSSSLQLMHQKLDEMKLSEARAVDMDTNMEKLSVCSCSKSTNEAAQSSILEFETENYSLKLAAEKDEANAISFSMYIVDTYGRGRDVNFNFFLDSDTTFSIAKEMVEQLDMSREDVAVIVKLIDSLIMKLAANWSPSSGSSSSLPSSSSGLTHNAVSEDVVKPDDGTPLTDERDNENQQCAISAISADYGISDFGMFDEAASKLTKDWILSSICSLSMADKNDVLKSELNAIDAQYDKCFQQLLKMREEAIEEAKIRWTTKNKIPAV